MAAASTACALIDLLATTLPLEQGHNNARTRCLPTPAAALPIWQPNEQCQVPADLQLLELIIRGAKQSISLLHMDTTAQAGKDTMQ
jgi:hypothetical protein